uniref:Putative e3 ubiquitin ligase n=1 Tax=Rhodnius prolixus TaxID=13249 RepID=R4G7X6_RHOPR
MSYLQARKCPKVIFTKNVRPFNLIKNDDYLTDYKFKISFETQEEASAFEVLLAHECPKCKKIFSSFTQLRDHVRRTHFLNYCDLCVENLKILSRERRCYTRQELATHRRIGDSDDRSHRGHPLCEFCDTRYMDNDELYRHLRRDHLYCHFCDADGLHQYYNTYDFLREHFRNEHYLCEEGDCYNEKFTAVFRTDIDLKAHKTSAHGKGLGKVGLKQARTLDIPFTLAPRPRPIPRRTYREEDVDAGAVGGALLEESVSADRSTTFAQLNTDCIEEFPSLGGIPASSVGNLTAAPTAGRNTASRIMRRGCGTLCEDDFPALGPETTQVSLKVNYERPANLQKQPPSTIQTSRPSSTNVSIQVNHPRFITTVTSHNTYNYHFPALDSGISLASQGATSTSVLWTSKKLLDNKPSPTSHQRPVTTAGASGHDPPPGLEAYPALTPASKSKTTVQSGNQTQLVSAQVLSASSSTDCEQPPLLSSSKTKKKKSKSKNANAVTNTEVPAKDPEGNSKKKSNNQEAKCSGDTSSTPSTLSKKKAKGNSVDSSNEIKTNNNVNSCNNNNRKVLKSPKLENVKANQINNSNRKKDDSTKTVQVKEKSSSDFGVEKKKEKGKSQSEKSVVEPDAFPALGSSGVPPGFEPKWQIKRPPPGLEKASGLLVSVPTTPSAPPGFNPLNGFPPLGPSVETAKAEYLTPPNFARRNSALVTKMAAALGPDSFELFKQVSFAFRSGNMPPLEYFSTCRKIMGPNTFSELFPELLALLPDIGKQQELWTVYESETGKDQNIRPTSSTKKKGGTVNNVLPLEVCATCYQVVMSSDLKSHLAFHALDNHFPALDSQNTTYNSNAWVQHK